MASNATLTHPFNCLLDEGTHSMLSDLAQEEHSSKANVVRDLIRRRGLMVYAEIPLCADGGKCRCPHAHVYGPKNLPTPPDPDRPL